MKRSNNKPTAVSGIKAHMEEYGLKYSWLCSKIEVSNSHLTNIMKGKKRLTSEINDKINKVLGTNFKL